MTPENKGIKSGLTFIKLAPNERLSYYFPRQEPFNVTTIKALCQTMRLSDIEESPLNYDNKRKKD